MPSYFYHIALELFSPPDRDTDYGSTTPQSSSLSYESAREALLPFQRRRDNKTTSRRSREAITLEPLESGSADVHGNTVASRRSADSRDQCPSSPSLPLRFAKDNFSTFENQHIQPDHRLDHISIQSIDMIAPDYSNPKRADEHFARSDEIATGIGTDILGGLHTKGKYVPLDQTLPDSIFGIVHLYRDAKETPSLAVDDYPSYLKGSSAARQPRDHNGGEDRQSLGGSYMSPPDDDCTTLCILAVPSYMSPSDFLGFVGEATRDEVSHFRMIKTARANRYMVLMKFRNGKKARDWQRDWNGKVFNSMEVFISLSTHLLLPDTDDYSSLKPAMPYLSSRLRSKPHDQRQYREYPMFRDSPFLRRHL
jgi:BRCA1-associated protein